MKFTTAIVARLAYNMMWAAHNSKLNFSNAPAPCIQPQFAALKEAAQRKFNQCIHFLKQSSVTLTSFYKKQAPPHGAIKLATQLAGLVPNTHKCSWAAGNTWVLARAYYRPSWFY